MHPKSIFNLILDIIKIALLELFIQLRVIPIMPDMSNSSLNACTWFIAISFFTVATMLYIFTRYEKNWREFFNIKNIHWRTIIVSLLLVILVSIITGLQISTNQQLTPPSSHSFTNFFDTTNTVKIILTSISLVAVGPFLEELLFRGVLISLIKCYATNDLFIIIFAALVFAIAHGWTDIRTFLSHFFVGLVTSWIRIKQHNLFATTLVHGLSNGALIIIDSTI